jgi:Asp-tRNA(Asn)/Glu-tRNA(Gln) amidotransferase A subunit family amidase
LGIDGYEGYDALGMAELVSKGEVKPQELLEEAVTRLEECNPKLNCVVTPMFDEARAAIDRGLPDGPLCGVPYLLKDLHLLYSGTLTTNGCRLFADNIADHDSEMVARYKRAGLVIFGKSASPEFGLSTSTESTLFGVTRNPWKDGFTAGGSSGGSSSAVAAGVIPAANASDGGGSIRIPASCCGLFGLKPTRGRIPFGPDAGEGWNGMSSIHAVTRSVRDSAALLDAVCAPERGAPYVAPPPERPYLDEVGRNPGRLRIALQTRAFNDTEVHPDCVQAAERAAELCRGLGHEVEEAQLEIDFKTLGNAARIVIAANLRSTLMTRAEALGRELVQDDVENIAWFMVQMVGKVGAMEYVEATKAIHASSRSVERFLESYDVLLTPTMGGPPAPLGRLSLNNPDVADFVAALAESTAFTQLFNASGNPSTSVPLHWNADGLPIGTQLTSRFGDEATLFRLSAQLEEAEPWWDRRAPLW